MTAHEKGMAHERMRFNTMTGKQLLTRLNKIIHREKLEKFIVLAREYNYMVLVSLATRKLAAMNDAEKTYDVIDKAVVEVMEKAVVKEVELLRPVRKFDFN